MKVEITHPDKILFPKDKITKQEFVEYYKSVARKMLYHLKDRPISMKRFPSRIGKPGFFQKNAPKGLPSWVKTTSVTRAEKGKTKMILCNDKDTLVWLANQDCIAPHIWLSRKDKPDHPDRLIFDLDPPREKTFADVIEAALSLRKLLRRHKMNAYVMTTGSKGLHVTVPLNRKNTFQEVRSFAKALAEELVESDPDKYTVAVRKNKRRGRVYIDIMRNSKAATAVAPYSIRAKPGAPIAMPLSWQDLKKKGLQATSFTIRNCKPQLRKNPWASMSRQGYHVPKHCMK